MTAAPRPDPRAGRGPAARQRRAALLCLLAIAGAALWALWHSPAGEEWRFSRMSVAQLQRARGGRLDNPRLLYYLGLRLNQRQDFPEADPLLRNAVGLDPDAPRLRDEWTRALLGQGLIKAAFGQLREFAGTHPNSAAAHFILGKFYFTQRSMSRAAEEFQRTLALDPGFALAWTYLEQAEDGLGNPVPARQAIDHALTLAPRSAQNHLLLASLLARGADAAATRREFARAAALAPGNALVHREFAAWLLRAARDVGGWRAAEAEARRAAALEGADAEGWLVLGNALLLQRQYAAAAPALARAAALAPDDPAPARALRQVSLHLGQPREAARWQTAYLARQRYAAQVNALIQALRVTPRDGPLHLRLAHLLGRHGDVAGCLKNYSDALHVAPDAPPALMPACEDLLAGGRAALALPLAQRAVGIASNSDRSHEILGDVLLALNQYDAAVAEYQKALTWQPLHLAALRARLVQYLKVHDPTALNPRVLSER